MTLSNPPWWKDYTGSLSIGMQGFSIISSSQSGYYQYSDESTPDGVTTVEFSDFSNSYNGTWAESTTAFKIPLWDLSNNNISVVYEFNATVTYPSLLLNFATCASYTRLYEGDEVTSTVNMSELISYVPST